MSLQFMNYAFYTHEKLDKQVIRYGSLKAYQYYRSNKVYTKGYGRGISDMEEAWPKRWGVWVDDNTSDWMPGKWPIAALGYTRMFKTAEFAVEYMEGVWNASQELAKLSGQHQNVMRELARLAQKEDWDAFKIKFEQVKKIAEHADKVLWTAAQTDLYQKQAHVWSKLSSLNAGPRVVSVLGHAARVIGVLDSYAQKRRQNVPPMQAAQLSGLQLVLGTLPMFGAVYAGSIDMGVNIARNVGKISRDYFDRRWDASRSNQM